MSEQQDPVVIVGGGQAGGACAVELRKRDPECPVLLLCEEPHPPYKRPPLSKDYLAGTSGVEKLYVINRENMEKVGIECRSGVRVEHIERERKNLQLSDGTEQPYSKLVLATGGSPRPLNIPGADRDDVFLYRSIEDVEKIKSHCREGSRLVIVGGGFIGLEVAAVMRKLGLEVTVLEGLPRVLSRVTDAQVSSFFERVHREAGVTIRTEAKVSAFEQGHGCTDVVLADEERIPADFVIVGIGMIPRTDLASTAGLTVDNGIRVDEYTRTEDPDIHAIGDCSNYPSDLVGGRIRLESVQNAMDQGRTAARNIAGQEQAYQSVPWFWSDQYEYKLQMTGISGGHDQTVLRGDPESGSFSLFYLHEGRLIAADSVSRPKDFMMAKKLVAAGCRPDPGNLGDVDFQLKELLG